MNADHSESETIQQILSESHNIAVVGLSDKPDRASYDVASYLQSHGYRIIPINPALKDVLGEKAYPNLSAVPETIDVVDIFRKSEDVGPIVDEAIKVGAPVVWMQLGIINEEAAAKARAAGLDVVMNHCMKREYKRLHSEE